MLGAGLAIGGENLEEQRVTIEGVFRHFLTDRKAAYLPLNVHAVEDGFRFASESPRSLRAPPAGTIRAADLSRR